MLQSTHSLKTMSLSKLVRLGRSSSSSGHYPLRTKTKLCPSAQKCTFRRTRTIAINLFSIRDVFSRSADDTAGNGGARRR